MPHLSLNRLTPLVTRAFARINVEHTHALLVCEETERYTVTTTRRLLERFTEVVQIRNGGRSIWLAVDFDHRKLFVTLKPQAGNTAARKLCLS